MYFRDITYNFLNKFGNYSEYMRNAGHTNGKREITRYKRPWKTSNKDEIPYFEKAKAWLKLADHFDRNSSILNHSTRKMKTSLTHDNKCHSWEVINPISKEMSKTLCNSFRWSRKFKQNLWPTVYFEILTVYSLPAYLRYPHLNIIEQKWWNLIECNRYFQRITWNVAP